MFVITLCILCSVSCRRAGDFSSDLLRYLMAFDMANLIPQSEIVVSGTVSTIAEGEFIEVGIKLKEDPKKKLTVKVKTNSPALLVGSQLETAVEFTRENYFTEQKIRLSAPIDTNSLNESATVTFSADGLPDVSKTVTVADDLAVILTGTVTAVQEGQTASIGVKLSKKTASDKTVTVSSDSPAITINGKPAETLNFTSDNYNIAQTLTLLAVTDPNSTSEAVTLTFLMPGSADLTYSLTVIDDNSIQVSAFPSSLLEGTSQAIGVRFSKTLLADTTITVTSNNPAITVNGGASAVLSFTTANGTVDQTLTLSSAVDANLSSESVTLIFTAGGIAPLVLNMSATDKDTQNMIVTGTVPTLDEGLTENTGKLKVALTQDPGGTATVTVTSSDTNALTVDPATTYITFDSTNWNIPRNINITALEDANETSETVNVIFNTPGAPLQIYNVVTIDNDTRILIGGASTVNEGGTNTVTVSLSGNPGVARDINLVSSNPLAGTLSVATLSLTPSNYSQNFTITGIQDANILSEAVTVTGSYAVTCTLTCTPLAAGTRNISTVDDDVQNILLSGGNTVNEGGALILTVRLSQDPTTPFTVNLSSSNSGSVSVSPTSITLTSANYSTGLTVTLNGVEDVNETSETAVITAGGSGVTSVTHNVSTVENDTKPLFSGATSVTEGNTGVIFVKLSGDPGTSRTVTLASSLPAITLNPLSVSFDSANWNIPQAVTVTGVPDTNVISEVVTVTGSGTGIVTNTQTVTANDVNTQGIQITGSTVVTEGTSSSTLNVRLSYDPTTPLTVNLTSDNPSSVTVSPASLVFNSVCPGPNCWSSAQAVTLTGVEENSNESTEAVTITAAAGAITTTWNVNTQDNDTKAVFGGASYVNEESIGAITIRLSADPGTTRTMNITSSDTSKISVITNTLSFNSSNWNIPQAVTLSALADMNVVDETVTITAGGAGLAAAATTVTSKDNDVLDMIVTNISGTNTVNEGGSLQFSVKLNYEPPANTAVTPDCTDTSVVGSPGAIGYYKILGSSPTPPTAPAISTFTPITFTPANYSTEQIITVYAPENLYVDDKVTTLSFSATGIAAKTFVITVKDNDPIQHKVVDGGVGPSSETPAIFFEPSINSLHIMSMFSNSLLQNVPDSYTCIANLTVCIRVGIISGVINSGYFPHTFIAVNFPGYAYIKGLVYFDKSNTSNFIMKYSWGTSEIGGVSPSIDISSMLIGNSSIDAIYDSMNKKVITIGSNTQLILNTFTPIGTAQANMTYPLIVAGTQEIDPKMAIDKINSKLGIVNIISGGANSFNIIYRYCNLDGTNCTSRNLSLENPLSPGNYPLSVATSIAYSQDPANQKLVVIYNAYGPLAPAAIVCNPDGSGCLNRSITSINRTGFTPSIVIDSDPTRPKKAYILTESIVDDSSLILWRCDVDITNCSSRNLSNWLTISAGKNPQPFIDPANRRLRIVTQNNGFGKTLSMFSMLLYID